MKSRGQPGNIDVAILSSGSEESSARSQIGLAGVRGQQYGTRNCDFIGRPRAPSSGGGKVKCLSKEEIQKLYPAEKVSKDSFQASAFRQPCPKGNGQVYIYGMADPRDGAIRYVGKSRCALSVRLEYHLHHPTNRGMQAWLYEMERAGVTPSMVVLEICDESVWEAAERRWIAKMRKLTTLLNVHDGGRLDRDCDNDNGRLR